MTKDNMYKIEDSVVCTVGSNKDKEFIVKALLKDGFYSCKLKDGSDDKYYQFNDAALRES